MSFSDPYVTLDQLKAYLRIEIDDYDNDLEIVLGSATREINKHTGRNFNRDTGESPVATVRTFPVRYSDLAFVHDFYSTTGLVIATGELGEWATVWSATDYQLEPLNGIRDGNPGWPFFKIRSTGFKSFPVSSFGVLQVTALWGWSEVPEDVQEACLMIAAETFKMREAPFGVAGWSEFGAVRVRDIPKVSNLLYPYEVQRVKVRG